MKDKTKKYKKRLNKRLNKTLKGGSAPSGYIKNGLFVAYTPQERYMMQQAQAQAQMYSMYGPYVPYGPMGYPQMPYQMAQPYQMPYQIPQQMPPIPQQMAPIPRPIPQLSVSAAAFVPKSPKSSRSPKGSKSPKSSRSPKSPKNPKGSTILESSGLNSLPNSVRNFFSSVPNAPVSVPVSVPVPASMSVPVPAPMSVPLISSHVSGANDSPPKPTVLTRQLTDSHILYDELLTNSIYRRHMTSAMRQLSDYELGTKSVFLREGQEYGVFRVDKKKDNDIYFNWDEIVKSKKDKKDKKDIESVQRCHVSLHNSTTDKTVNKSAGSLHVKLDEDGSSKRICIFHVNREFHIAIKDEINPMLYTPLDVFAEDVVQVLLKYYENTGRTAMKIDSSFCTDTKPEVPGKEKGK